MKIKVDTSVWQRITYFKLISQWHVRIRNICRDDLETLKLMLIIFNEVNYILINRFFSLHFILPFMILAISKNIVSCVSNQWRQKIFSQKYILAFKLSTSVVTVVYDLGVNFYMLYIRIPQHSILLNYNI